MSRLLLFFALLSPVAFAAEEKHIFFDRIEGVWQGNLTYIEGMKRTTILQCKVGFFPNRASLFVYDPDLCLYLWPVFEVRDRELFSQGERVGRLIDDGLEISSRTEAGQYTFRAQVVRGGDLVLEERQTNDVATGSDSTSGRLTRHP